MDAICRRGGRVEIGNQHLRAFGGQPRRDCSADPAGTARDDRDLACKPSHPGAFS
jgi:hypothetical protein